MQLVYEIKKIYTLRQSLSIRHVASGEEGVAGPLYFAQQRFLKYSNIKSEWSRSCPSPPPIFWAPSKIEVKIKEMISEDVVIKIMIIRYFLPPFSRFGKVGVLFVSFFFWLVKIIWTNLAPTFKIEATFLSILSIIILILFFKIKFTTRFVFVNN